MIEIKQSGANLIEISGRLDASQVEKAQEYLNKIEGSCTVDFTGLEYISSAGLGVLLATLKRLSEGGHSLKLTGMTKLVRDVFRYSRLDTVFIIE